MLCLCNVVSLLSFGTLENYVICHSLVCHITYFYRTIVALNYNNLKNKEFLSGTDIVIV